MSEMSLVEAVRSLLDNGTTPSLGEGYIPTQEDVMRTRLALEEYDRDHKTDDREDQQDQVTTD